jgi:putative MATE family efflux protein
MADTMNDAHSAAKPAAGASEAASQARTIVLTAPLRTTVLRLAWPVFIEQFLIFLVGFTDTFLAGCISKEATTAVGLAAYVGWLASNIFSLVSIGTVAVVSRHWGAAEFAAASQATNRAVSIAVVVGLAVYVLIWFAAPWYAALMQLHGATAEVIVRFLRIDGAGYLFSCVTVAGGASLRATGQMRVPMLVLTCVNVMNVVVSIMLSGVGPAAWLPSPDWFGIPRLGLDGIAWGTLVARGSGGGLMLAVLASGWFGLRLSVRELSLRGATVRRILRVGIPAGFDGVLRWSGQLGFLMIIARLSDLESERTAIMAAHLIGMQVEAITFLPASAWGLAAATLVGQSLGAKDPERARCGGHEAVRQSGVLALLLTALFYFGAGTIYEWMHRDTLVQTLGVGPFRFNALFQLPLVASIVYTLALQGAGETRQPMLVGLLGVFGVRLPLAYLCGIVWQGGLLGGWIGMCSDNTVRALLVTWIFHRGRWMRKTV